MGKVETRPAQFSRTSVFSRHQSLALKKTTYAQTLPPLPILRHERPLSGREPRRRVCFFLDTIDRRFVGKQSNKFVPSIILFCFPARAGPQLSRSPSFYSPCCWLCRVCHSDHSSSRKSPDQTPCLSANPSPGLLGFDILSIWEQPLHLAPQSEHLPNDSIPFESTVKRTGLDMFL